MILEKLAPLAEGGVAGHLQHPYEALSPAKFVAFINDLLKGRLEFYEKVDGVALTVGLENGQLVYLRSKKGQPSADIEEKFPISHPGSDAFRAGFKAVRKGFSKLTPEQIKDFYLDRYFINIEIIYGFIPNIIPYSDTKNYIIFHYYVDPANNYEKIDINDNTLDKLANTIGTVSIVSDTVNYVGTPSNPQRIIEKRSSLWEFHGPIKIKSEDIKQELTNLLKSWKSIPEILQLRKEKDPKKQFELMKAIASKIGSNLLSKMVSRLSTKQVPGLPSIEGLVTRYKSGLNKEVLLKITGDFRELNQQMWAPIRQEIDPIMSDFNKFVLTELVINGITRFSPTTLKKYKGNLLKLFKDRSMLGPLAKIRKQVFINKINEAMDKLEKLWNKYKNYNSVKAEDIKKALLINGYKLKQFKHDLLNVRNAFGVFKAFMKNMFGVE